MKGINLGINVIVGQPLTAKSVTNFNDMPKFYGIIDTPIYKGTPTQTNTTNKELSNIINNSNYTNNLSQKINPINKTYIKTDTYNQKQQFTNDQTQTPTFDMSSNYNKINFNYQTKE